MTSNKHAEAIKVLLDHIRLLDQSRPPNRTTVTRQAYADKNIAAALKMNSAIHALQAIGGGTPTVSCAECGKRGADGWALYCVECMDKIKGLFDSGSADVDSLVVEYRAQCLANAKEIQTLKAKLVIERKAADHWMGEANRDHNDIVRLRQHGIKEQK